MAFREHQAAVAFGPTAAADAVELVSGQRTAGADELPRSQPGTAVSAAVLIRALFEAYQRVMPDEPVPMELAPPGATVAVSARALAAWPQLTLTVPRSIVSWMLGADGARDRAPGRPDSGFSPAALKPLAASGVVDGARLGDGRPTTRSTRTEDL